MYMKPINNAIVSVETLLFIVFEINFNAKQSHVCRLPAEEVVLRIVSVS